MSFIKISNLPLGALSDSDELPAARNGTNVKISGSAFAKAMDLTVLGQRVAALEGGGSGLNLNSIGARLSMLESLANGGGAGGGDTGGGGGGTGGGTGDPDLEALQAEIDAARAEAAAAASALQIAITQHGVTITNLTSSVSGNSAEIHTEQTARATADTALSGRIDSLTASVGGNLAQINSQLIAFANADSALTQRIDGIVSASGTTAQRIWAQATQPVAYGVGDLWIDTAHANRIKWWNGTAWVDYTDTRLTDAIAAISTETTARTTQDSALANQIAAVLALANNNAAAIVTEQTARADQDSALATQIQNIVAASGGNHIYAQSGQPPSPAPGDIWIDIGHNNRIKVWSGSAWVDYTDTRLTGAIADIATETTARTTADSALASQITALTSATNGQVATINTTLTTLANADSALASRIDNIVASSGAPQRIWAQSSTPTAYGVGDLWIDLGNSNRIKYWTGSAWVDYTDTRLTGAIADIASETTARTTQDTALASQITALTSATNGQIATINSTLTTLANADSATATQISTVSASAARQRVFRQASAPTAGGVGDVWYDTSNNNKTYVWSGSAWQDTDNPQIAANAASITTEASARAAADGSISAKYAVKVDVNGYVSGFGLISDANNATPTSTFTILADNFRVAKPGVSGGSPVNVFDVSTVGGVAKLVLKGDMIADGSISANSIGAGTITAGTINVGSSNFTLNGTAQNLVVSNGTFNLVKIGQLSAGVYGIELRDASNNVILSTSSGVPASKVSGLGSLATQSSVSTGQVSGLGSLATQSSVSTGQVTGLGSLATVSQITSANASTYIASAAIGSALIGNLDASRITTGTLSAVSLAISDTSGNWILKADAGGGGSTGALLWKPTLALAVASNLANPTVAALDAVSYGSEAAVKGTGVSSNSGSHGVRGMNSVSGTSGLVGAAASYDFYAEGTGTNYGPFTGAHDALMALDEDPEVGDIVADVECMVRGGISNTLFRVTRSVSSNQKAVVGVVAVKAGLLADHLLPAVFQREPSATEPPPAPPADASEPNPDQPLSAVITLTPEAQARWDALKNTYNAVVVNAVGEGQIQVCGENGDLEAGDLIVASSMIGKGMRQADDLIRGYTVAKARENVSFSSPSEVKLVACIYLCG